jgi:hypothetical protein
VQPWRVLASVHLSGDGNDCQGTITGKKILRIDWLTNWKMRGAGEAVYRRLGVHASAYVT